jgi:hypothetical protein
MKPLVAYSLDPHLEWPCFEHPERLFSLRLPRGWKEIKPLSQSALFAATSPGGHVLLEILVAEANAGNPQTGLDIVTNMPNRILQSLQPKHPDVRVVWQSEAGTTPSVACRRLIVEYTEGVNYAAAGVSSAGMSWLFTTDYFFLGGERCVLFANYKVIACQYPHWAGLFERITRGISAPCLGQFGIVPRIPLPMASLPLKPSGWITCYLDPIAFSYPPDWKETPPEELNNRDLFLLSGPSGTRLGVTIFDSEDWKFNELLKVPSPVSEYLMCLDPDAQLVWQGEAGEGTGGHCVRAIAELPRGVRPSEMADYIVMVNDDRALMFLFTAPKARYNEMVVVFENIARTAVVGLLGPLSIRTRQIARSTT